MQYRDDNTILTISYYNGQNIKNILIKIAINYI